MRPSTARLRTVIVTVALIAIAGGCGGGQTPPEPEPDPGPRYEQIPEDLCDQVRVEDVAERFDLSMAPWYERISNYSQERTHWYERCTFTSLAEDGRFAAELVDFQPSGAVAVRVYHDLAEAEDGYDQDMSGAFEHRADTEPGATITDIAGWWDSGVSLEWVREVDPDAHIGDDDISNLVVSHLVRHGNLVVEGYLGAVTPVEETAEALAFLHELQRALIDEAVEHLSLTG